MKQTIKLHLQPEDNERLANLCGSYDEHLQQIEKHLGVQISNRGHEFQLTGDQHAVKNARRAIERLYKEAKSTALMPTHVNLVLRTAEEVPEGSSNIIDANYCKIKPRSPNQRSYVDRILHHTINFGIGPAGTGKTYLAVACAVQALLRDEVQRIMLVRPAVEAGEKLGFLPGDLAQKVDPYLRPLYDALYEMLGFEQVGQLLERRVIEIAPLAFMRGRSLNEAFIILDESQNTSVEQMKMFLTRIGFGSKAVVNGDLTQIDLPKKQTSGLHHAIDVLSDVNEISFTHFIADDVVRHPIVQRIIEAYDAFEKS